MRRWASLTHLVPPDGLAEERIERLAAWRHRAPGRSLTLVVEEGIDAHLGGRSSIITRFPRGPVYPKPILTRYELGLPVKATPTRVAYAVSLPERELPAPWDH